MFQREVFAKFTEQTIKKSACEEERRSIRPYMEFGVKKILEEGVKKESLFEALAEFDSFSHPSKFLVKFHEAEGFASFAPKRRRKKLR